MYLLRPQPEETRCRFDQSPQQAREPHVEARMSPQQFGGENLLVSSKTDRIYKKTPTGNIWIGNAGAGRFAKVAKHEEE